jgi:2-hydroxy-3-oxopropionate reductase
MNELKLGFIGLGNMGMPMARSLLKAGFPVTVFDLRPEALAEIRTQGAVIAGSPAEVAKSGEIIISMVRDESQTEEVLFGRSGVWEGIRAGQVIIISSTVSPGFCRQIYARAKKQEVNVIDAPVTDPSGQNHILGGLTIMVGGDKDVVTRCWPVLEAMGKNIFYMGDIGNGEICKLVHQINSFNINLVTRESLNIGVKAGLDLKTMVQALSLGLGSTRGLQAMAKMLESGQPPFRFKPPVGEKRSGWESGMGKDWTLAMELAQEIGADIPIAHRIKEIDADKTYEAYSKALKDYIT